MPRVAVIGLGRFGIRLARQLGASGTQVLAIDNKMSLVNEVKDDVDLAVKLDSTDEGALASHDLAKADALVVAIGENFEAALLTTVIAKKLGVKRIICRARTDFHAEIFRQIGADEIIQPEAAAGESLAHRLANPFLEDFLTLADGFTLIEFQAPRAFQDKTLIEIGMRQKYGVNLVGIKRTRTITNGDETEEKSTIISMPKPDDHIREGDILVVVGQDDALAKLPKE